MYNLLIVLLLMQAVLTLTMTAARVCPGECSLAAPLLLQGPSCAAANIVCKHRDAADTALACMDSLVGVVQISSSYTLQRNNIVMISA